MHSKELEANALNQKKTTSQFAPKETQVAYQVPFSFSHPAPSDACKEPAITRLLLKI
jgi:hypothetical protein